VSQRGDWSTLGIAAVLVAGEPRCLALAERLFPGVVPAVLSPDDFAPPAPFEGSLFALIEAVAQGAAAVGGSQDAVTSGHPPAARPVLALVVPAVWYGADSAPAAVLVADHVNLTGRGPLTGRWPAGRARAFPSMTGIYRPSLLAGHVGPFATAGGPGEAPGRPEHQPLDGRPAAGRPVYSALAVAGVADADRLTPFESRQMRRGGLVAAAGLLVAPVVIAAYHGLAVAAAGAVRVPRGSEGTS
jgi:hypothetical protein